MRIGINSNYIKKKYHSDECRTDFEAACICKDIGYDCIDYTPSFINDDDWKAKAHTLAEQFAEKGISVEQSHAPFNRYSRMDESIFKERMCRTFEASAIIGAKYIVVHGDEYTCNPGEYNSTEACRFAYDYFAPFVELAKKIGIGVAFENVFEDRPPEQGRSRCCSLTDELITIIDSFNDPDVTCCWDFGHAHVAFGDNMLSELKKVGNRLSSTHVHDNTYSDTHLPLYFGKIDWDAHVDYLKKSEYKGAFTYEFVYGSIPDELLHDYLKTAYKTACFALHRVQ